MGWSGVSQVAPPYQIYHAPQHGPTFADGAVCLKKVWAEVGIKQVARQALDRVIKGEHLDALAVWDVSKGLEADNVADAHTKVVPRNACEADAVLGTAGVWQCDADLSTHRVEERESVRSCVCVCVCRWGEGEGCKLE